MEAAEEGEVHGNEKSRIGFRAGREENKVLIASKRKIIFEGRIKTAKRVEKLGGIENF